MTEGKIASIVLAAGVGQRFGGQKQLAMLRGKPLLEHALASARLGAGDEILVVLGADADEVEGLVGLDDVRVVRCADWRLGRGASLASGLRALGAEVSAALISLGDEPFLDPEVSRRLVAARRPDRPALRATYGGRPGHPVLIERTLFESLGSSSPGANPAALLRQAGIEEIECGDICDPTDVDTPEQLAELERTDC